MAALTNQSLFGAVTRALHTTRVGPTGTAAIAGVGLLGVLMAAQAARRGEDGTGFAMCALTSLLISPISWTHHWVLAIPALITLVGWAWRRRAWAALAAATCLCLAAAAYVPELLSTPHSLSLGPLDLASDPYVILGTAAVALSAIAGKPAGRQLRHLRRVRRRAGRAMLRPTARSF